MSSCSLTGVLNSSHGSSGDLCLKAPLPGRLLHSTLLGSVLPEALLAWIWRCALLTPSTRAVIILGILLRCSMPETYSPRMALMVSQVTPKPEVQRKVDCRVAQNDIFAIFCSVVHCVNFMLKLILLLGVRQWWEQSKLFAF